MSTRVESNEPVARPVFLRCLRRRCPQCGRGRLFRSVLRLADDCEQCGLVYQRESGAVTGSMYLSAAVTQIVAASLLLAVPLLTDWSPWFSIAVTVPPIALFCYAFLPVSRSLWVAVEYWSDLQNEEVTFQPGAED